VSSVAVVVPTFNRLSLLRETVESLRAQTLRDCEFILVDDRSDEETRNFLDSLSSGDSRFRVIEKSGDHPAGAQTSRNIGFDAADADAIVFLDSDDLLASNCLEQRYNAMRLRADADIVVGRQAILDPPSGKSWWINIPDSTRDDLDRFLAFSHPIDVPWVNGGVMIRAASLRHSGVRWRPEFHWDDVAFHVELLVGNLRVYWMPREETPDAYYRMHHEERYGSMLSTDTGLENTAAMIGWMCDILNHAGKLDENRRRALAIGLFNACILPAIDRGNDSLAAAMLNNASRIVTENDRTRISAYLSGRASLRFSRRATYYWNRLAAGSLLPAFFVRGTSTYGTVPVSGLAEISSE
jgi:glycosyltransferase involved in cell wall biosynthesis